MADIDGITQLVMLEDTRQFDEAALATLLKSSHPEVRRRAVIAVARIVNPAGRALLVSARKDDDVEIVATVAFATGQLKDPDAVPWLSELLMARNTPPAVGREAAQALGKIRTPAARTALAQYLAGAPDAPAAAPVVGEALLAIGRFTTREDIAPIVRWATAADADIRWRAAWALFRPRDPAAVPHLLKLSEDPSAEVRFWAMRGLAPALVTEAGLDLAKTSARLRDAVRDPDRRVRTEALRVLVQYDDDASFAVVLSALDSTDTWLSVSAAEALGRFKNRIDVVVPRLVAAAAADATGCRSGSSALAPLAALAPSAAADAAAALVRAPGTVARTTAIQVLQKLGEAGRAQLDALAADPATKALIPQPGSTQGTRPTAPPRTAADYRRIVERWIVPDYNGAAKPRAVLTTPRGEIELELYAGDAPLGVEYFVTARRVRSHRRHRIRSPGAELRRAAAADPRCGHAARRGQSPGSDARESQLGFGGPRYRPPGLHPWRHAAAAQRGRFHRARPRDSRDGRGGPPRARRRDHGSANRQIESRLANGNTGCFRLRSSCATT